MEIWLFNIGRSVHAYLRNVPISSGKNHHTSLPAYPERKALGIAGKSPEGNEDLQRIVRPEGNALKNQLGYKRTEPPSNHIKKRENQHILPKNLFPKVCIGHVKGK